MCVLYCTTIAQSYSANFVCGSYIFINCLQDHSQRISLNLRKEDIEEISRIEIAAMKERSRLRMSEYQELEAESESLFICDELENTIVSVHKSRTRAVQICHHKLHHQDYATA